jgi:hypothetical protein
MAQKRAKALAGVLIAGFLQRLQGGRGRGGRRERAEEGEGGGRREKRGGRRGGWGKKGKRGRRRERERRGGEVRGHQPAWRLPQPWGALQTTSGPAALGAPRQRGRRGGCACDTRAQSAQLLEASGSGGGAGGAQGRGTHLLDGD